MGMAVAELWCALLLFPRRSFVIRIPVVVVVSVLALTARGSSPSPLSPSVVPASILIPATDAPRAPHSPSVRSSSSIGVIVINRGDLELSSSGGRIAVSGTRGFSLTAAVSRSAGIIEAFDSCFASNCDPGRTIPLDVAWSGTDLPATMTLDGQDVHAGRKSRDRNGGGRSIQRYRPRAADDGARIADGDRAFLGARAIRS